jgi:hypothetical protein
VDDDATGEDGDHSDAVSDYDASVEEESVEDDAGENEEFKNTERGLDGSYWKVKCRKKNFRFSF